MSDRTRIADGALLWTAAKLLVLALALIAAVVLVWQLAHVLLLLFGAVLVAVLLRSVASLIEQFTPIPGRWAVGLACLLVAALLGGFAALLGAQIRTQALALVEATPDLIDATEDWLGLDGIGGWLDERRSDVMESGDLVADVASTSTLLVSIGAEVLVVIASGIYLALSPGLYRDGLVKLVPAQHQPEAQGTLDAVGRALKLWLLGQLMAMLLVGVLTTFGLWLLGVPSALALGFLAGLLEFVPFVGPLVSAVPAVALSLAESPATALWTAGLYVVIQQVEGNLITPLIQQRTVNLPPVLTIFAILAFGVLFGPLGVVLASPLAVVCFVLVKKLWVREVLHEAVELPGEAKAE